MVSLRKNVKYQIGYRIITVLTPLITSPIISRALGSAQLGVFSATLSFVNYFMLFAMLGVDVYGNRSIAQATSKEERQSLFWNIYAVQCVSALVSLVVYFSLIFILLVAFLISCLVIKN